MGAATLEWDANTPPDNVTNYLVRWGTNTANVGTNLSYGLTNVPTGVHRFTVVAQANGLDSDPSQEVAWTNKPSAPKQFRLRVSLQSKEQLDAPWDQDIRVLEIVTPADRQRIYRLGLAMEQVSE